MAAKSLKEAFFKAGIKDTIGRALCIGPAHEIVIRIDLAEKKIIENVLYELRDYFAHQAQYADRNEKSVIEFFDHVFKGIEATRRSDDEH